MLLSCCSAFCFTFPQSFLKIPNLIVKRCRIMPVCGSKVFSLMGTFDFVFYCSVPMILQVFNHESGELVDSIKDVIEKFDPDEPYWKVCIVKFFILVWLAWNKSFYKNFHFSIFLTNAVEGIRIFSFISNILFFLKEVGAIRAKYMAQSQKILKLRYFNELV